MGFLWPRFQDTHGADRACSAAAGVAFFLMLTTVIVTWLQTSGKIDIFPGLDSWAYIDAALFGAVGVGLTLHSRFAAVSGVLIFIFERVMTIQTSGFNPAQMSGAILFGLILIHGVRGAFAWHILRKKELAGDNSASEASHQTSEPKARPNYARAGVLLLILAAVGGGAFFYLRTNQRAIDFYGELRVKIITVTRSMTPKVARDLKAPPKGPAVQLKLKSGRIFEGILTKENEEGIWLYLEKTGEVFFSRSEIAEKK